jgi:PAS domain S-box-containing protein
MDTRSLVDPDPSHDPLDVKGASTWASGHRLQELLALTSDWYFEQDAQLRFSCFESNRSLSPEVKGKVESLLGLRRWEMGLQALSASWDAHRAELEAHRPYRDFEFGDLDSPDGMVISASGNPVFDAQGAFQGYRGVSRDITARKRAERDLQEAQAMLQIAGELGRLGGWALDEGDDRAYCSEEMCRILGLPDHRKVRMWDISQCYLPAWRLPVHRGITQCFETGAPFDVEAEAMRPDGSRAWVRVCGKVVRIGAMQVRRIHGAVQDVTATRQAQNDLHRLNGNLSDMVGLRTRQLESANAEMEAFAYSFAHDLKAPLSSLSGYAKLLAEQAFGQQRPVSHYVERITGNVARMSELIEGLQSLARVTQSGLQRDLVDIGDMAHAHMALLGAAQPEVAIDLNVLTPRPVLADVRLLRHVLGNLLDNAWKFSGRKPVRRIEVGQLPVDGPLVTCFVRDEGAGFDPARMERLFSPFHRLHSDSEFEGTGIGLALVRKIIERHGGTVWAQAEPDAGATFYFTLPAA